MSDTLPTLSYHDPRAVLRAHGLWAKKKFGQNFLIDPTVPARIASAGGLRASDRVFEIGAGLGTLTRELAQHGAQITALEFDTDLVPVLRAETALAPHVTVRPGDVRGIDWAEEAREGPLLVYGNLPYHLSTEILTGLLEAPAHSWHRAALLLQLEFAQRVAAQPGEPGCSSLSALTWMHSYATIDLYVPPEAFHPAPKVSSAVLVLERRPQPAFEVNPKHFRRVVQALFAQRRKMARSALKSLGVDVATLCERAGVDGRQRGEALSLAQLAALSQAFSALTAPAPPPPGAA